MKNNYDFPVELRPVHALDNGMQFHEIPNRKAVVRTDTNKSLGIVSNNYKLLKHEDVVTGVRSALGKEKFGEHVRITKNGGQMFAQYTLRERTVEVRQGDLVGLQFTVKNSYDGSNALRIMLGGLRLVCTNGMVLGQHFFSFKQRHVGEGLQIQVEQLQQKIEFLARSFHEAAPSMQAMAQTKIEAGESEILFTADRITLPEYLLEAAKKSYQEERDGSVWGVYNAFTHAISHNMKNESPVTQLQYGRIAWKAARAMVSVD